MIPSFPGTFGDWGDRVLLLDGRDLTSVAVFEGMSSFCHSQ